MSISIVVIDDHTEFRREMCVCFKEDPDFNIVGEGENGLTGVSLVKMKNPDIVLMDINMPDLNGMATTRLILESNKNCKIIALTMHAELNFVAGMFEAGAHAYIMKDNIVKELKKGIRSIMKGNLYLSRQIEKEVFQYFQKKMNKRIYTTLQPMNTLGVKVMDHFIQGQTGREIAESLSMKVQTVEKIHQKILHNSIEFIKRTHCQ
jgi:DNA-binding NarL/FixJ family response regulator